MTETAQMVLDTDLQLLNVKEVADILRVAPVSVYRLIARRVLPVYRTCRKILFKKRDVIAYLESSKNDSSIPEDYGSSQG